MILQGQTPVSDLINYYTIQKRAHTQVRPYITMMNRKTISISALVTIFFLSGCAELFLQPYGEVMQDAENVRVTEVILPDNAPSISQGFNPKPLDGKDAKPGAGHEGIDIYAAKGTPVIAPAAGIIRVSYSEPFYGNQIVINHGRDENGAIIHSRLLHLDTRLVEKGDIVLRGEQIGSLGSSGMLASYPHLHFEIHAGREAEAVNPHTYWMDGPGRVTCFDKDEEYPDLHFRSTYPVPCRKNGE